MPKSTLIRKDIGLAKVGHDMIDVRKQSCLLALRIHSISITAQIFPLTVTVIH